MTLTEIAANAETAVDALTSALNNEPDNSHEVAEHLRGIAQSLALALYGMAQDAHPGADLAGAAGDALLAATSLLVDLAEAMREVEREGDFQRAIAA